MGKEQVNVYNVGKCEIVHFGRKNKNKVYHQNSEGLGDLCVLVHESQKASMQVQQVIRKVNRMLLFIVKGIDYKRRDVIRQLYRTLV